MNRYIYFPSFLIYFAERFPHNVRCTQAAAMLEWGLAFPCTGFSRKLLGSEPRSQSKLEPARVRLQTRQKHHFMPDHFKCFKQPKRKGLRAKVRYDSWRLPETSWKIRHRLNPRLIKPVYLCLTRMGFCTTVVDHGRFCAEVLTSPTEKKLFAFLCMFVSTKQVQM